MADDKRNGVTTVSDTFLSTTRELVEKSLTQETIDEDREAFFEALFMLQSCDISAAVDGFRRAARTCAEPFDALSAVSLAECERIRGRQAAAIREWKKIADDDDAPHAARYVAWLSLAALAEERDDERLERKAQQALEELSED
jgi:hypothetical protein